MANPFSIPLNALRAIEIVARRGALAPAAEELGVTIGAVSQHLRRAEERLGMELFEADAGRIAPPARAATGSAAADGRFCGAAGRTGEPQGQRRACTEPDRG